MRRASGPAAWPRGAGGRRTRAGAARGGFSQGGRVGVVDRLPLLDKSTATSGGATQRRTRAMRVSVAGAAACFALLFASLAVGAASFSDAAGDHNEAPDITSVQVSEAADGLVTIVVGVRNYPTLPSDSWFNVWFDLDSNPNTGDAGDETLVRYVSNGEL